MERHEFDTNLGTPGAIDFCCPCRSIWFDSGEATRLAPGSVILIFGIIYKRQDEWRRPLAAKLACPRCRGVVVLTHDLGKSGPFTYYRCGEGHGRFTPFTEVLREKQFVRVLAPQEMERVRAEVKQVRCSGCGAMIDLGRESACSHCRAPITILDAGAVEKALHQLNAEAGQREEQRARLAAMLAAGMPQLSAHCLPLGAHPAEGIDLVDGGIKAIGGLLHALGLGRA